MHHILKYTLFPFHQVNYIDYYIVEMTLTEKHHPANNQHKQTHSLCMKNAETIYYKYYLTDQHNISVLLHYRKYRQRIHFKIFIYQFCK